MKTFYLILILILFSACRAKQVTNESHYQEQTKVQNDIHENKSIINEDQIKETLKRIFDEELEANLTITTYDTDKPIDPETKKPPIKEETNFNVKKKTSTIEDKNKEENITSKQEQTKVDKSTIETNIDQVDKGTETIEQTTFEKVIGFLKLLVGSAVVLVVIVGARKIYLKIMKSRS